MAKTSKGKTIDGGASSAEQIETHLDALDRECEGYEARLAAAKSGLPERLTVEQLEARVAQVDEQRKHYKKLLGKA